jgi:prolyl 4-hydroxylase
MDDAGLLAGSRGAPGETALPPPGFHKARMDARCFGALVEHFRTNLRNFAPEPANDFIRTTMDRFHPSLLHQDPDFNDWLLGELQQVHEAWSGRALKRAACYGIRVYQRGSFLRSHVDRSTHVVSSTICVDARLSSPWPLQIEDVDGKAHEIVIEPGELLFFAGRRLKHGRPHPLDGDYYATIFAHYTPTSPGPDGPEPDR